MSCTLVGVIRTALFTTALVACQAATDPATDGPALDDASTANVIDKGDGRGDGGVVAVPTGSDGGSADSESAPSTCKTNLTPFLTSLAVPGLSATIVKNGRVVCSAVAGIADRGAGKPVTPETGFLWASVSKTVTAAAVMQLYEQGKFGLDDDIGKYLGFSIRVPTCTTKPITFRQLLTHTSSIKDNDTIIDSAPVAVTSGDPTVPLSDLVKGYLTPGGAYYRATGNFESGCPGTISDYSNMGVATLGYLVQVISGQDLHAYFRDHIFAPLGMTNSAFRLADLDRSKLAAPNGTDTHYGEADFPDGMLRTSPRQLGKFLAMITNGGRSGDKQVLKASTIDEMLKKQTTLAAASTGGVTQGLVWYSVNTFGRVTWGHDGDDDGASSNMFFDPATKAGVLLVANGSWAGDPGAVPVMNKLFEEAAGY